MHSKFVFGPVPSRRLGLSLGIDILPHKTCTLDCIYCECGKTTHLSTQLDRFFDPQEVISEVTEALSSNIDIDYITFSGSGEPTLNKDIKEIIQAIQAISRIPVAILTNGSLLFRKEVAENILSADLVIPSLDTAIEKTFYQINRPAPDLKLDRIISGLIDFRKTYTGVIWLEMLFVKGVNDSVEEVKALSKAADEIRPDRIQLNTCLRPGTEPELRAVSTDWLQKMQGHFHFPTDVITDYSGRDSYRTPSLAEIIAILKRRPCTLKDLSIITQTKPTFLRPLIEALSKSGHQLIVEQKENREEYFRVKTGAG